MSIVKVKKPTSIQDNYKEKQKVKLVLNVLNKHYYSRSLACFRKVLLYGQKLKQKKVVEHDADAAKENEDEVNMIMNLTNALRFLVYSISFFRAPLFKSLFYAKQYIKCLQKMTFNHNIISFFFLLSGV